MHTYTCTCKHTHINLYKPLNDLDRFQGWLNARWRVSGNTGEKERTPKTTNFTISKRWYDVVKPSRSAGGTYVHPYISGHGQEKREKAGTKEKDTPTRYGPGHGRVVLQQRKRVHIDLYIDTHVPEYNICARISTLGLTWGFGNQGEGGVSTPPLVQIRLYQRDFLMYKSNSII